MQRNLSGQYIPATVSKYTHTARIEVGILLKEPLWPELLWVRKSGFVVENAPDVRNKSST
jgi:hypothetical protein